MSASAGPRHTTIALTAGGVTVLIDATTTGLPVVAYWGPALPGLDREQAEALLEAGIVVVGTNNIEPHPRVAVLPEHHTGWTGRPGLRGSYAGAGWSPAFVPTSVRVDGAAAGGFVATGPATVAVDAACV